MHDWEEKKDVVIVTFNKLVFVLRWEEEMLFGMHSAKCGVCVQALLTLSAAASRSSAILSRLGALPV